VSDVVGPYDLHIEGDDYVFTWDGGVVEARLSRLSEGKGETSAEIMVSTTMPPAAGVLEWGRINLSAMSTRASLAKQLAARCPGFDWQGALLQVSARAVKIRREGEPTIDLRDVQPRDTRWLLWPYIEYGGPTVMFADGGTGKSVLALAMGYSVATGKPLLGTPKAEPKGVLYLDWETDSWTHAERLRAIHTEYAFEEELPTIRYKRMVGSLADSATQLRAEVSRWGIGLTIVDSLSLASGGPLEESASATTFFDAVRSLNTCILAISHVSKGSMQPDNKGKSNPFGSIYWRNTARIAWFLESAREEGSDVTKVRFENVKSNNGRIQNQHGYRLAFHNKGPEGEQTLMGVSIKKIDLTEEPEFAGKLSWAQRLMSALSHGRMTTGEVAEALDVVDNTVVSKELSKLKNTGKVIRLADSTWALAAK